MIKGKLSNDYEIEVDERKAKTHRFTKLMGKALSDDPKTRLAANAEVLSYLIGEEKEDELIEYIESQTGEEATEAEVAALTIEIINMMTKTDEEVKK